MIGLGEDGVKAGVSRMILVDMNMIICVDGIAAAGVRMGVNVNVDGLVLGNMHMEVVDRAFEDVWHRDAVEETGEQEHVHVDKQQCTLLVLSCSSQDVKRLCPMKLHVSW